MATGLAVRPSDDRFAATDPPAVNRASVPCAGPKTI